MAAPMQARPATICVLRSIRSANSVPRSGPAGCAMAIKKAYSRLRVRVMPRAVNSVGSHELKP